MLEFPKDYRSNSDNNAENSAPSAEPRGLLHWLRIKLFPGSIPKEVNPLQGRLRQLRRDVLQMKKHLAEIKEEICKQDEELCHLVNGVTETLLRDVEKLREHVDDHDRWLSRANGWVSLYRQTNNREEIIRAVIEHFASTSEELFARDVGVIKKYQEHCFQVSPLSNPEKERVQSELLRALETYIDELKVLQKHPKKAEFKHVVRWRKERDPKRQELFEKMLRQVDDLFSI